MDYYPVHKKAREVTMLKIKVISYTVVLIFISGCGEETRKTLGLGKRTPDEFQVVRKAPLVVPPNFTLRPPDPGAKPHSVHNPKDQAREALFGPKKDLATIAGSAGEFALLKDTGVDESDPDIRKKLSSDRRLAKEDKSFVDNLMFWKDEEFKVLDSTDPVVDSKAEAERFKKNKAEGKIHDSEKTVTIIKRNRPIDKLF